MSSCCGATFKADVAKKYPCPLNGQSYAQVQPKTIAHHIKSPWCWVTNAEAYYFCTDPLCDVAYFGSDNSVILKSELRTHIGVKESEASALLCYCFGVSKADFKSTPAVRDFVIEQTKVGLCACDTRNPSGLCCLRDFPKL